MHKLTLIKLVTSITLQALISVFAYKFVYQYNTLTVLTGIFCLGALLRLRKMKNRILKTGQKVLYLAGRICLTVGLFILINNVFVMKVGKKNCSSCATNTVLGIVGAGILLFYYFCVWVFFTYCDYKEYEKSVE